MTERYIIDDCGTLIDIETRNTYDYVDEICPVLNRYETLLRIERKERQAVTEALNYEIENAETPELKKALIRIANKELSK